ncbi:MAG TPA: hypothetical protein VIN06_13585 [Devosia sp.]
MSYLQLIREHGKQVDGRRHGPNEDVRELLAALYLASLRGEIVGLVCATLRMGDNGPGFTSYVCGEAEKPVNKAALTAFMHYGCIDGRSLEKR